MIKTQWVNAICSWAICFFTRLIAGFASVSVSALPRPLPVCVWKAFFALCEFKALFQQSDAVHCVLAQLCFSNRVASHSLAVSH